MSQVSQLLAYEHMFVYCRAVEYREEPCRSALNRVKGMPFNWSLNPYMGCVHRCTFCYVRAFERRADRPVGRPLRHARSGSRPTSPRCSARELPDRPGSASPWRSAPRPTRTSRPRAATGSPAPASRRWPKRANPFGIITRGPMIVRDVDVLAEAARRATSRSPSRSRRSTRTSGARRSPARRHPRQRLRALSMLVDAGIKTGVGMAPILPGISDRPNSSREVVSAAREAGATGIWANLLFLRPGTREHFLEHLAEDWPELLPALRAALPRSRVPRTGDEAGQRRSPSSRANSASPTGARPARAGRGTGTARPRGLITRIRSTGRVRRRRRKAARSPA